MTRLLTLFLSILCSNVALGALYARDLDGNFANGHEGVYDDVLDITWLADANYVSSSGFDLDGLIDWYAAESFVANLNTTSYLGVSTWRQASASGACTGFQCGNQTSDTDDELGYQYYQNFGAIDFGGMANGTNTSNMGLFSNVESYPVGYWTGTELDATNAYAISSEFGDQSTGSKLGEHHVWVVTDGDVGMAVVPLPATIWFFLSSFVGLFSLRWKFL